jgi:alkanesulfonate monooxygenase SsuD/methylene tetrahydromethanopterin reductase-like flavin-dependent oxidoreductase (luciferase family)
MLVKILDKWRARARQNGLCTDVTLPISAKCFIGDTVEEARAEARGHLARFYRLQAEHYTTDTTPWDDIPGYEQFAKIFANMRLMGDATQNDPILDRSLVGTPETVARQINALRAIGFDYFIISNATHGVPREARHRMMRRFAEEVVPLVEAIAVPDRAAMAPPAAE